MQPSMPVLAQVKESVRVLFVYTARRGADPIMWTVTLNLRKGYDVVDDHNVGRTQQVDATL